MQLRNRLLWLGLFTYAAGAYSLTNACINALPVGDPLYNKVVLLIGPPGAGKSTLADLLRKKWNVPHLAVGGLLRQESNRDTERGRLLRPILERGDLAPPDVVKEVLADAMSSPEAANGFILDGSPRTVDQIAEVDQLLAALGKKVNLVVILNTPKEVVAERLKGRRVCGNCQASYHVTFDPPTVENVCDRCQNPLQERPDDKALDHRWNVYKAQTGPVIQHYILGKEDVLLLPYQQSLDQAVDAIIKVLSAPRTDVDPTI